MERKTVVAALLTLQVVASAALPAQQQLRPIITNVEDPTSFIMGERLVEADLKIKPSSNGNDDLELLDPNFTSYNRPETDDMLNNENDPVDFESNSGSSAPAKLTEPTNLNSSNKRTTLRLPSGGSVNVASANPIYITIPIYINKAEGQPLRLSVGGQGIPIAAKPAPKNPVGEPYSPTSQFNRLLQHDVDQIKHTKTSNKASKKKTMRHTSASYAPRKSHHTAHLDESRRTQNQEDSNPSVFYRFYF